MGNPASAWVCFDGKAGPSPYPPLVFCTQDPCFHELADKVSLQIRHNKGVDRSFVQDKELEDDLRESPDERDP
jgi:hypothetical protein